MNKKAEFNLSGMLIATLTLGLFMSVIGITIIGVGSNYDTTGYNAEDLSKYNYNANITTRLNTVYESVDTVTVNPNIFDYLAGLFNSVLAPFKFIYNSFGILVSLTGDVVTDLQLDPVIKTYITAVLIVLVIVGIVMIKFFLNRQP